MIVVRWPFVLSRPGGGSVFSSPPALGAGLVGAFDLALTVNVCAALLFWFLSLSLAVVDLLEGDLPEVLCAPSLGDASDHFADVADTCSGLLESTAALVQQDPGTLDGHSLLCAERYGIHKGFEWFPPVEDNVARRSCGTMFNNHGGAGHCIQSWADCSLAHLQAECCPDLFSWQVSTVQHLADRHSEHSGVRQQAVDKQIKLLGNQLRNQRPMQAWKSKMWWQWANALIKDGARGLSRASSWHSTRKVRGGCSFEGDHRCGRR